MRFKNTKGVLKLYAVAGTQTVLLSFDLDAKLVKKKEFLGFSIERIDPDGTPTLLNGSKYFDSLVHDNTVTDPKIKYASLVQSYFWKDYQADPGSFFKKRIADIY
jgi:hypothetical protein